MILSAILFPIKSPVASAIFEVNCFYWSSFKWTCSRLFSMINKFLTILLFNISTHIFSKRKKSIISWLNWIVCHFLYVIFHLITNVMYILSSISRGLEFCSVNHTSIYENSESNLCENRTFSGEVSNNWRNDLLGTNVCKTLVFCW